MATLIIPSPMERRQSIAAACVQKIPDSVVKSVSRARHWRSRCVRRNDQFIDQFKVSRWCFLHV